MDILDAEGRVANSGTSTNTEDIDADRGVDLGIGINTADADVNGGVNPGTGIDEADTNKDRKGDNPGTDTTGVER